MSTSDSNQTNNIGGFMIALGLLTCLMYVTYIVMHNDIPEKNQNTVVFILGFLTAQIGTVINWYYGTSSSNKKQADTIATQALTIAQNAPASSKPDLTIPPGGEAKIVAAPLAENQP